MKTFALSAIFAVTFIVLQPASVSAGGWDSSIKNPSFGYCPGSMIYVTDVANCRYYAGGTSKRSQRAARKRR